MFKLPDWECAMLQLLSTMPAKFRSKKVLSETGWASDVNNLHS